MLTAVTAVGVPDNVQFAVLSETPAGSAGATAHDTIAPPEFVTAVVVIARSFVRTKGEVG